MLLVVISSGLINKPSRKKKSDQNPSLKFLGFENKEQNVKFRALTVEKLPSPNIKNY